MCADALAAVCRPSFSDPSIVVQSIRLLRDASVPGTCGHPSRPGAHCQTCREIIACKATLLHALDLMQGCICTAAACIAAADAVLKGLLHRKTLPATSRCSRQASQIWETLTPASVWCFCGVPTGHLTKHSCAHFTLTFTSGIHRQSQKIICSRGHCKPVFHQRSKAGSACMIGERGGGGRGEQGDPGRNPRAGKFG